MRGGKGLVSWLFRVPASGAVGSDSGHDGDLYRHLPFRCVFLLLFYLWIVLLLACLYADEYEMPTE